MKAGATIVNVENSLLQTGFTVLEVLNKLPGVLIDQNGNISLFGRQGVSLMVNGKLSRLSGQDLLLFLQSEPSSNVKSVEIIKPAHPDIRHWQARRSHAHRTDRSGWPAESLPVPDQAA